MESGRLHRRPVPGPYRRIGLDGLPSSRWHADLVRTQLDSVRSGSRSRGGIPRPHGSPLDSGYLVLAAVPLERSWQLVTHDFHLAAMEALAAAALALALSLV